MGGGSDEINCQADHHDASFGCLGVASAAMKIQSRMRVFLIQHNADERKATRI